MSEEKLLKPKEFCQIVGISYSTLKQWVREGRVKVYRTTTGRWRIPYSEVERILGIKREVKETRAIIYARVSPNDQKGDLERQVEYLMQYCSAKGYKLVDTLSDIASGLNANRRGLLKLFDYVINRKVDVIIVTYKDRLTRFGFEYLEYFFKEHGVIIEVVYGEEPKDYQELIEDLMAIVTSFAGKLYGLRSHRKKEFMHRFKELLEEVEKGDWSNKNYYSEKRQAS